MRPKQLQPLVLVRCIDLKSPSDPSNGCECYQVKFVANVNLRRHYITMCREWLRYMAGMATVNNPHPWASVIEEVMKAHFGLTGSRRTHLHQFGSKAVKDICKPLGYFPDHFIEQVTDFKFGTLFNSIPLDDIIRGRFDYEDPKSQDIFPRIPYYENGIEPWRMSVNEYDMQGDNAYGFRKFCDVIRKLAEKRPKSVAMCEFSYTKEDIAAALLYFAAKDQQPNPQNDGADKSESTLPQTNGSDRPDLIGRIEAEPSEGGIQPCSTHEHGCETGA